MIFSPPTISKVRTDGRIRLGRCGQELSRQSLTGFQTPHDALLGRLSDRLCELTPQRFRSFVKAHVPRAEILRRYCAGRSIRDTTHN